MYGYLTPELVEEQNQGICKIGGCIIDDEKNYYCKCCHSEFKIIMNNWKCVF